MSPMKHAGATALDRLEPLLAALRALPGLKEKARGVFYRGGRAFLHFHEDPAGLIADLRLAGPDFERFRVETGGGAGGAAGARFPRITPIEKGPGCVNRTLDRSELRGSTRPMKGRESSAKCDFPYPAAAASAASRLS